MPLHIVLYQPEIPYNTGNIGRTCLATNTALHLIEPLGFSLDDKSVKRSGLDYWPHVDLSVYQQLDDLFAKYPHGEFYYIENFGESYYDDHDYADVEKDIFFIFGNETKGFPRDLLVGKEDRCFRVHMAEHDLVRSLNLSNTAAIIIYEALRQQGFPNMY